jgi:Predicted choline kinase involved in LPS biosynthesis
MLPLKYQLAKKSPIAGGLVNHCFQLQLADERCFLREGVPHAHSLGIDRYRELYLLRHSLASELSPELLYADPETGLLVTRWVDATTESVAYWQSEGGLKALALLLARIHNSSLRRSYSAITLDLGDQLRFYLARISVRRKEQTLFANKALARLATLSSSHLVLCHNDLSPGNILCGGRWVVDWEYAALGDAAFDIATACRAFDLSLQQRRCLMEHYYLHGGVCQEARVTALLPVADVMHLLWLAVYREFRNTTELDVMYQTLLERMMAEAGEW